MPLIISFTWCVVVIFLILTGEYAILSHNCSAGYKADWNICYMITNKTFTWEDARRYCQQSHPGADLASIYSDAEMAFIFAESYLQPGQAWIGFTEIQRTGRYSWTDGGSVVFTKWGVDEPSRGEDGGCVSMHEDGKWYDDNCEELKKAVCKHTTEPPVAPPPSPEGICPGAAAGTSRSWQKYDRHCYYFEKNIRVSWTAAQVRCMELGGITASLASIHDIQENRFILAGAAHHRGNPWIGLHRKPDGTYHWTDGTPLQFQRWVPGEPSSDKHCVVLSSHQSAHWYNYWCSVNKGFVCKTEQVTLPSSTEKVCPGNNQTWEQYNENCYYFVLDESIPWPAAQARCKKLAGETASLASIHDNQENRFIHQHVAGSDRDIWIGLYVKSDGTFVWNDESHVKFQAWGSGQPTQNKEHCAEFSVSGQNSQYWNDIPCSLRRGFVCKTELVTPSEEPNTGRCPEYWQGRGSHCYYFEPNVYKTWDMAQMHCKEFHNEANLASVKDQSENTWIRSQMTALSSMPEHNNYWLGLQKTESSTNEDKFQWTDNAEMTYRRWDYDEPKNGGFKNCVEVNVETGLWRSVSCVTYRGYVCKMPKESSGAMSGGQIAGIVIGVLLGVVLIIAILLFVCYAKKRNQSSKPFDRFTNLKSELATLDS